MKVSNLLTTKLKRSISKSLKAKVNLTLTIALIIIFSVLTTIFYQTTKDNIVSETKRNMESQLDDLKTILTTHVSSRQNAVNTALSLAGYIFYGKGELKELKDSINVSVVNQENQIQSQATIPIWSINNLQVYNNFSIVDQIKKESVEVATIFQKINDGFLRISTNVTTKNGERAIGTYIPNTSEVAKTILEGKTYYGRAFAVGEWYLTAYEPIVLNNEVKGILCVGVKEMDYAFVKSFFSQKKFFDSGYPFIIQEDGNMLIHPNAEGKNLSSENFFKQIIENKKRSFHLFMEWGEKTAILHLF